MLWYFLCIYLLWKFIITDWTVPSCILPLRQSWVLISEKPKFSKKSHKEYLLASTLMATQELCAASETLSSSQLDTRCADCSSSPVSRDRVSEELFSHRLLSTYCQKWKPSLNEKTFNILYYYFCVFSVSFSSYIYSCIVTTSVNVYLILIYIIFSFISFTQSYMWRFILGIVVVIGDENSTNKYRKMYYMINPYNFLYTKQKPNLTKWQYNTGLCAHGNHITSDKDL